MSFPPPPPGPFPASQPPAHGVHAPPLPPPAPVIDYPFAVAHATPYSSYGQLHARPGALTGIGVTGIVVACLSIIVSLFSGCEVGALYFVSKVAKATTAGSSTFGNVATVAPVPQDTSGLDRADRETALNALIAMQPLNDKQRNHLSQLLKDHGLVIFPTGGIPLTNLKVQRSITRSYRYVPDDPSSDQPCTAYVGTWGTIKVFDDKADFVPTSNGTVLESIADSSTTDSTDPATNSSANASAPTSQPGGLTPAQVTAAVQAVQRAANNRLTPAQISSLTATLSDPNQPFVSASYAWSPVRNVTVDPQGNATIVFSGGFLVMDPNGAVNQTPFGTFNLNPAPCVMVGGEAAASLALSIVMLIAAIMTLRQTYGSRRLMLFYAVIKIPLAIVSGIGGAWLVDDLAKNATGSAQFMSAGTVGWLVAIPSLIFPVIVLIVFNLSSIRAYYRAARP